MGPSIGLNSGFSSESTTDQSYYSSEAATPPSEENPPESSDFIWTWRESLLVIPLGLIVLGTIFGNLLVLYAALTRSQHLRLPTHFIIANLAAADFLVGVLVMPFLATLQITGRWYFGPIYCEAWAVIHFWLCSASILSTCAVCIERYIGVRFPLNHKQIMNQRMIRTLILCVWLLAGTLSLCSLYIWPQPRATEPFACAINQQIGHVVVAVVGILYVPALIMIVLYWKIFVIARSHLKFVKNNSFHVASSTRITPVAPKKGLGRFYPKFYPSRLLSIGEQETSTTSIEASASNVTTSGSSESLEQVRNNRTMGNDNNPPTPEKFSSNSGIKSSSTVSPVSSSTNSEISLVKNVHYKKQINLAKRLSFLVGILLASYLPFFTLYMIMAFRPGSIDLRVFNAFGWIRYFNSCLNPIIYAFAVPAYRKAMLEILRNGFGRLR